MSRFVWSGAHSGKTVQKIHLEVVIERDNVPMAAGHAFQDCDLIPDLRPY